MISNNGWNIAHLKMHSGLFVDTLEYLLSVKIKSLLRMDFKHSVKPSDETGTFMKHLRSWIHISTERYAIF